MDHFAIDILIVDGIEVRNLERPHRLDGRCQHLLCFARRLAAKPPAGGAKGAQHLRAVESLSRTVVAEAHDGLTIVSDYHRQGAATYLLPASSRSRSSSAKTPGRS